MSACRMSDTDCISKFLRQFLFATGGIEGGKVQDLDISPGEFMGCLRGSFPLGKWEFFRRIECDGHFR